ncbi:MAG: single-stranded-DNA-specific exonuclease RecJ, partial [Candidatus Aminicenantes bacterium]|nr:single-stranded-DNA-specific exonuclease RecJ [Candidatus Aminicenantes bacterium]
MNPAVWVVHPPRAEADALAQALDIPPAIARVLVNRKILTEEAAREFLFGDLDRLHDPYLMKDMDKAVARVETAIARGEK